MNRTGKLSLFVAIMLLLQLSLIGLPAAPRHAEAAPAGPSVLGLSPADDLINVPLNTDLKITFDESVSKGTSSAAVSVVEYGTNRVLESISVSSSRIVLEDSQRSARIVLDKSTASRKLELNTDYYVLVDAGAFVNVSNGAAYAGIQNASSWNFRTVAQVDSTRPAHLTRLPTGNAADITAPIVLTFDEPVFAASGNIQISSTEDNRTVAVTSSAVTGSGTSTITVTPAAALQPDTTYTVTIPGTAFQDASGNLYNGTSWTFHTDVAPVNSSGPLSPADNATSVAVNSPLTITFDTNVQARAGKSIEIRRVSNNTTFERFAATSSRVVVTGNSVRISPSSNLEANTAYYVLIDAGAFTQQDPNGDKWYHGIASATVWNFSTDYGNDTTAPAVTAFSPANNAVVTSTNSQLQLTFNEPVFPSGGMIEIRESGTGALFRSIPLTSERVTGGGTYQITIDPNKAITGEAAKAFVNNTRYYVTMGNRTIRDAAGNYYAGFSSSGAWTFTVTQDTVRPTLALLSPLNNATLVSVNGTFSATFSEPVLPGGGAITFKPASGSIATEVAGSFTVDSANNRKINITPASALVSNTVYYVYIEAGAVTDLAGNSFAGILNEYQWTFRTFGSDTTAPSLSKLQWSGSTISVIYNETLNPESVPSAGSFYVTVNGASRPVSHVEIRGESVLLTLTSPIVSGQTVKLAYTKESPMGRLQDLSGNEALSIGYQDVTGALDTTLPSLVSGTASGSAVTLVFSKELAAVNSNAYLQFTVTVGGVAYSATSISSTGSTVLLTVSGTIQNYQNVRVSYAPGAYALRDTAGNYLNTINHFNLYSVPDTTAPVLQSITASGSVVTLTYNKTLNPASVPSTGQYSVLVDNVARAVVQVQVSGNGVYLTLSSAVSPGQVATVSYLASIALVTDLAGNPAPSFNNVSSGSTSGGNGGSGGGQTGSLYGAIAKGSLVTLNFGDSLNGGYIPSTAQFAVVAGGASKPVSGVSVSGNSVTLVLSSPVSIGVPVYVTYYSSVTGLRTLGGVTVNSFTNVAAANQTTVLDGLSGDYEAADGGGIGLKTTAAETTIDVSPAGVQASRYTVMSDRVLTAYQTMKTAGLANPRVVFKVPSTERAAIVAVSVGTLDSAYRLNSDFVFAVQYGDTTYELQLSAADFTRINGLLGGSSAAGQLLIRIDTGISSLTGSLSTKINSSGSQLLAGPYHFDVAVASGSVLRELDEFDGYVSRTIQNYQTVDASRTAVVWLDPETGGLSYVPTEFSTSAGRTVTTFKRKGNSAYALIRNASSFSDLGNHWAAGTIHLMSRKFIVEAKSGTKFELQLPITRGEFASYIAKGLGLGGSKAAAASFKDVKANTAMGAYIGAASSAGIVLGSTDGTFKPDSPITRQDMAVMLIRAAKVAELSTDLPQSASSYLQKYTDRGKISSYAQADMAKAVHLGVINGITETTISPLTNATRAEGTIMLMRLLQKAKFLSP
ncbi:Ig-like domain-containing protein [Paenibacillus sp. N4]|uniref:Ig-like domain-containing protein n=1 Tax=Paenibacillus vietnamensis TaxID=2590547 RepID=UPI001CD10BDC|nr:Ig-like domain-containing protein [Paenibacillus vietnamensis]MCA0757529.1 Ig-like domain-containing protein [Paenibacillus vietnamensis]